MTKISLHELIKIVPDLISLFLPGFIFMSIYNWIKNKKTDFSLMVIWSLFISYIITILCSVIHKVIFINYTFDNTLKSFIYLIIGFVLPFIFYFVGNTKLFSVFLRTTTNKTINQSIFDDIIDYKSPNFIKINLKTSNITYIGSLKYIEENGKDSYIALENPYIINQEKSNSESKEDDKETNEEKDKVEYSSILVVSLQDIDRIEFIY